MAATKIDPQAAKQAKQKKILIVLGVVLLALLAIQLPKFLGGSNSTPAATPATTTTDGSTPIAATPVASTTPTGVPVATPVNLVTAGAGSRPKATEAQLASFSLFKAKDPFVQKIIDKSNEATGTPGAPAKPAAGGPAQAPGGVTAPSKPEPVVYGFATISLNGEEEPVITKGVFPADDPMFQVVAIGKNQIKLGIAGGKLTNSKVAVIKLGKSLTLVNDATGARYVIKLLYTGTEAEPTATFTPTGSDPAAAPTTTTP